MAIAVSAITSCFELNILPPATRTSAVNAETMARLPRISTDTSKTNYTSGSKSLKITYLRK
jgi:hypothetical protein